MAVAVSTVDIVGGEDGGQKGAGRCPFTREKSYDPLQEPSPELSAKPFR